MKKILILFAAVFALASCEMDLYRSDQMTAASFKSDPDAAVYSTDGNYSMFKDELSFGMTDRGGFSRVYWLMTELRGDNTSLSGITEDPLQANAQYNDDDRLEDLSYLWYICYKIIYGCNVNIETLTPGFSPESDHLLGENFFLRAVAHFSLCNVFATPYMRGADKPGVVIRTASQITETKRATVGEVYAQIEADLKEAMKFMQNGTPRGNKGYASYDAARGLLTRLYLYMGRNDECVALCNEMLGSTPAAFLDPDIKTYYANALTSVETLWCIGRHEGDASYVNQVKGQLSSMYYKWDGVDGWCEIYWSQPLIDLLLVNPNDARTAHYINYGVKDDGKKMILWPEIVDGDDCRSFAYQLDVTFDENAAENTMTWMGNSYVIKKKQGNGYPIYYIEGMYTEEQDQDGVEEGTRCWVRENKGKKDGFRTTYVQPMFGMTKFTGQKGYPGLSSPVYIRWAEIILNRAEANAKLGNDADALADVNVIRQRAGLTGNALWSVGNIGGYESVLDVVLDERRLELCFEGHRAIDQYRNNRNLDLRYGGLQPYRVITPAEMDIIYPYCIPYTETSVSGIPGNGRQ